jgi:hypothetical protein
MATKTFGSEPKTSDDYVNELYKHVGIKFPLSMTVVGGRLVTGSYETTWEEGGTEPKPRVDKRNQPVYHPNGEPVYDYVQHNTKKKLTDAQIKKIDAWMKENVSG